VKVSFVDTLYFVAFVYPREQWRQNLEDRFGAIESDLTILPRAVVVPEGLMEIKMTIIYEKPMG